ncbi:hypothetical protein GQ457_08G013770 [Hibiscus cannabinus]
MSAENLAGKWTRKCGRTLLHSLTCLVFLFLDFLDALLCVVFKLVDEFFEGEARTPCYCGNDGENKQMESETLSDSLCMRRNVLRKMGFLGFARKWKICRKKKDDGDGGVNGSLMMNRWSDCGCNSCVSWTKKGHAHKLHVVVTHLPLVRTEAAENVIFLHGFLSSSSFGQKQLSATCPNSVRVITGFSPLICWDSEEVRSRMTVCIRCLIMLK